MKGRLIIKRLFRHLGLAGVIIATLTLHGIAQNTPAGPSEAELRAAAQAQRDKEESARNAKQQAIYEAERLRLERERLTFDKLERQERDNQDKQRIATSEQAAKERKTARDSYDAMTAAANQLVQLADKVRAEIDEGGKFVISAHINEDLDRIQKLTKQLRELAKTRR